MAANLRPHPGGQWASAPTGSGSQTAPRRRLRRSTYKRPSRVRHLLAGYDLSTNRLYRERGQTQEPHRVPRVLPLPSLTVPAPDAHRDRAGQLLRHLSTKTDSRAGNWAKVNKVTGLCAVLRLLTEPDRGPSSPRCGSSPRRHRRRQPPRAGQQDPSLQHAWRNRQVTDSRLRKLNKGAGTIKPARLLDAALVDDRAKPERFAGNRSRGRRTLTRPSGEEAARPDQALSIAGSLAKPRAPKRSTGIGWRRFSKSDSVVTTPRTIRT